MTKRILLLTDFSQNSWIAIKYGIMLFEKQECDYYILNVYTRYTNGHDQATILDPDEKFNSISECRSRDGLGVILTELTDINNDPQQRFHVISRAGYFLDTVQNIIGELQIELIIMGAKGITHNWENRYGKNTLEVIEGVRNCPVLAVPKSINFNRPGKIIFATDFKTGFKLSELDHLTDIAELNEAVIRVYGIVDPAVLTPSQKSNILLLQKHFEDKEQSYRVYNQSLTASLSKFENEQYYAIITYINKRSTFWEWLGLCKRTLLKIGYQEKNPVLALPG